jgi:phage terminase large subunit
MRSKEEYMSQGELQRLINSGRPETLKLVQDYLNLATTPFFKFEPRPDNLIMGDQQTSFVADKFQGIAVCLGGTASGKSYASAYKVADFLRRTPPMRKNLPFWCLSQTLDMASANGWQKNLSQFIPEDMIHDVVYYQSARNLPKSIIMKNWLNKKNWVIEFRSFEMDRKALQAYSLGGFWIDELCPFSILIELYGRCRDYNLPGSMIFSLTPLVDGSRNYTTWELEDIYKNQEGYPNWKFYHLNSLCNKALAPGFIEQFLASEIEQLRETRTTGAFTTLSGAIYKGFNDTHICEPHIIPDDWYRVQGLDFGWSHATCLLTAARSPTGDYVIYDEYYASKQTMQEHADEIKKRRKPDFGPIWADSAAAQERHDLARMGVQTELAKKDVLPGIACVQMLLRENRLKIFNTCKNLIREMRSYRWSATIKDKVDKQMDDAVDSCRYLLFSDVRTFIPPKPLVVQPQLNDYEREKKFMWSDLD